MTGRISKSYIAIAVSAAALSAAFSREAEAFGWHTHGRAYNYPSPAAYERWVRSYHHHVCAVPTQSGRLKSCEHPQGAQAAHWHKHRHGSRGRHRGHAAKG